ncbi:MAG: Ig-like domain-containing protein [Coriobacteriales bacterium]|nr:Ig-like domain-containing protein [Coriobacteriales bacterium]
MLTVNKADNGIIIAEGGCLTVYAQSEGEQRGSLAVNVTGNDQAAFFVNDGAQITINGGTVKAAGTGDGIYAHSPNGTCAVTINGGRVDASANGTTKSSYGIYSDGSITINGGEVTASANNTGANEAIGIYGNETYTGTVTINGGKVTASANCTGTGSAYGISGKTVTVNNGLTVMADDAAPGTDVTSTFATDHTQKWVHIQKVIPVDSVSLDKTSATLTVGDTETLTATIDPEDATNKTVTWKSGNEHVATVDENGMVTAVGVGTATITVTSNADNTKSASCTVTVKAKPEPKPGPKPDPEPVVIPDASVTTHVQRIGWMAPVADGTAAGTTGKSRRMEALTLKLPDGVAGGIEYRGHVQRSGWEKAWAADGATSGTTGKSRRMEAVQIRLTGEAEKTYDVYYRVHSQRYGWMAWAKNGEQAGTQGMSRRAEAIQVVLVKKGDPAPDATYKGVTQQYAKAFVQK